jgi:septal ring factor EnvC (AmiA/AmiB activator)
VTIEQIAQLGGFAGIAALLTTIFTLRGVGKRASADATRTAAETIAALHGTISGTIERLEEDTSELREQVSRLETELADSRREILEMTDSISELSARIDAALDVLEGTRDPQGEAARNILTKPRQQRKKATGRA